MRWVAIACCFLSGCTMTLTIAPTQPPKSTPHRAVHASKKNKSQFELVDADWIEHYKQLEVERGHFTIPQDGQITATDGKFRVPLAVREHYQDMIKAKDTPSPNPTPTP